MNVSFEKAISAEELSTITERWSSLLREEKDLIELLTLTEAAEENKLEDLCVIVSEKKCKNIARERAFLHLQDCFYNNKEEAMIIAKRINEVEKEIDWTERLDELLKEEIELLKTVFSETNWDECESLSGRLKIALAQGEVAESRYYDLQQMSVTEYIKLYDDLEKTFSLSEKSYFDVGYGFYLVPQSATFYLLKIDLTNKSSETILMMLEVSPKEVAAIIYNEGIFVNGALSVFQTAK